MSRERRADAAKDKDLWGYPQYYTAADFQGILSPLSLNGSAEPLGSHSSRSPGVIKREPYLDNTRPNDVFGDSGNLLAYGDSQQIGLHDVIIVTEPSSPEHHHSRLHEESVGAGSCNSHSSNSGSGIGDSCSESNCSISRRRRRLETVSQRQERLRKNAERGKMRRLEETDEQRHRRLARNAERGKLRRMEESQAKREERLRKNAGRQKARRNQETPEERQLRLWKNAERQRIRRNAMAITTIKEEFVEYTGHEHLM